MTAHKEPSHLDYYYLQIVSEFLTLPYRVVYTCSEVELSGDEIMCGSREGDRGSRPPSPRKITSYMGFYRNSHLDPGPRCSGCFLAVRLPPPPTLTKIPRSAHADYAFYQRSPAISRCAFIDVYTCFACPKTYSSISGFRGYLNKKHAM